MLDESTGSVSQKPNQIIPGCGEDADQNNDFEIATAVDNSLRNSQRSEDRKRRRRPKEKGAATRGKRDRTNKNRMDEN